MVEKKKVSYIHVEKATAAHTPPPHPQPFAKFSIFHIFSRLTCKGKKKRKNLLVYIIFWFSLSHSLLHLHAPSRAYISKKMTTPHNMNIFFRYFNEEKEEEEEKLSSSYFFSLQ